MRAVDESLSALFLADDPRAVLRAAAAIAGLSSGRVRKPEGLNGRTGKPERDGLYCARIFGPVEDHRCLCGKLDGAQAAGQTCDRCGVLCGERRVRGERWGHIESPVPLVHPRLASQLAGALGCSVNGLLAVLRFEADLREDGTVVPSDDRRDIEPRARGPWYIAERLGERAAEWMLTQVPVTPPDWRGTRSDPQDAGYMRLLNRCNRLERLIELNAPEIILWNEAHQAQQAFDQLYVAVRAELGARGPVVVAPVDACSTELLTAIYDDPDDDAARRAYAAHLEAVGDPRGEFIRLQLAHTARSRGSRREADLLRRNFDRWLAPFDAGVATEVVFRRGFLAACKVPANCADPRIGDPAWATLEHVDTERVELVTDPVMRGLRSLALPFKSFERLCEGSAVLPRIDALQVRLSHCPPPQVEAVTRCEALPGLRALTLVHRPARGLQGWGWLDGTPLARQLERLSLVLALERVETLSLPWWVGFMQRHSQLGGVDFSLGTRLLAIELRRDGEWLALRVTLSRGLIERIAIGAEEVAQALARGLTAMDPYGVTSVRVESPCAWFGDELDALARAVRGHFGAIAKFKPG